METALKRTQQKPKVLILSMSTMLAMDATGLNALEDIWGKLRRGGCQLILNGPHTQPMIVLQQSGFLERLGFENVCGNLEDSLARARRVLGQKQA